MAPIILAGYSHMCALVGDIPSSAPTLLPGGLFPEIPSLYGPWPRDSSYWETLAQVSTAARVAIIWEGNDHNAFYFFRSHSPFDFWSKFVTRGTTSFQLVPQRKIRESFRPSIERLSDVVAMVQKNSPSSVAIVGTPPPKEDADELRRLLKNEPFYLEILAKAAVSLDEVKITPASVRLKLWYLLQEMMEEAASKSGAQFISIPQETMDGDGYLRREYWAQDITHANHAYGEIMARKLLAEIW